MNSVDMMSSITEVNEANWSVLRDMITAANEKNLDQFRILVRRMGQYRDVDRRITIYAGFILEMLLRRYFHRIPRADDVREIAVRTHVMTWAGLKISVDDYENSMLTVLGQASEEQKWFGEPLVVNITIIASTMFDNIGVEIDGIRPLFDRWVLTGKLGS